MKNDVFVDCNSTVLSMFGCKREEILFRSLHEFSPPNQPDGRSSRKKALEKMSFIKNIQFITTDGSTIPVKDNSIDAAFSYLVFQHIKTKDMIESNFKEVYRVLRHKGVFKVRVRTDKVDLGKWWGGVACDEKYPLSVGFELLKREEVADYGLWLWLIKP